MLDLPQFRPGGGHRSDAVVIAMWAVTLLGGLVAAIWAIAVSLQS